MNDSEKLEFLHSWELVRRSNKCVSSEFYAQLLILNPEFKKLFKQDNLVQRRMFRTAISLMVQTIRDEILECPYLVLLGKRHEQWGVTAEEIRLGEQALLSALETCLAEKWSPALRRVWKSAYSQIAEIMLTGYVSDTGRRSA